MEKELQGLEEGSKAKIHLYSLRATPPKIPNWKTPGHNGKHGFWFKEIHLHPWQTGYWNEQMLRKNPNRWPKKRPSWSRKTPKKEPPTITCLPMIWKILIAQIKKDIYYSLMSCQLFSEDQKECWQGTRGTGKLLYIVQHIFKGSKMRHKNVATMWINF